MLIKKQISLEESYRDTGNKFIRKAICWHVTECSSQYFACNKIFDNFI